MTLILNLTPEQERRLRAEAERVGLPVGDYALRRLLDDTTDGAAAAPAPGSRAELFAQWRQEDATDDLEELIRRDTELEELKANLNANRAATGESPLFP